MRQEPASFTVTPRVRVKFEQLKAALRARAPLVVAFSGGVDSAFLLRTAVEAAPGSVRAILGVSASLQRANLEYARRLADRLGLTLEEVETQEMSDPSYLANGLDRCFHCKDALFGVMAGLREGVRHELLVDGTNADDLSEIRPGRRAAEQHQVWSPLAELGWKKADVREMSRALELESWNRPASPCLSSRIPHGTPVTVPVLRQIEQAEKSLKRLGFEVVRVRHHGVVARVEVPLADFPRLVSLQCAIAEALNDAGYETVELDPSGYRTGGADDGAASGRRDVQPKEIEHE